MKKNKEEHSLDHHDEIDYVFRSKKGLNEKLIRDLSKQKGEPEWMLEFRLKALKTYDKMELPKWGPSLKELDFDDIYYYLRPIKKEERKWKDVPKRIRETFEKIGVPKAEQEVLAGVKSQFDSEVVYGSLKKMLLKKGVIFLSMDEGVVQYPELVREYLTSVVPIGDNKLSALNSAVWSGGSFIYVPKGVEVELPLQAYFRINAEKAGQFERTLIVADEGSRVHYLEGCSAPVFSSASLHCGVVEVVVKKRARVQYTTVQNWYKNVYNLVTKRALVEDEGEMRWVDGNLGSRVTMKYPACVLKGKRARGEMLSIAWAGEGQILDAGARMIHLGEQTVSRIVSKSISKDGGRSSYRGKVSMEKGAVGSRSRVVCDALILDEKSKADTYPTNIVMEKGITIEHEASVSRVEEEKLFYLMSRGLKREEVESMMVSGFLEEVIGEIPLEYAVEMNRLVNLEMKGSVG